MITMAIANVVRMYLKNKPYILEAMESGIVNLSALSRIIGKSLSIKNYAAIKAALRRYSMELRRAEFGIEAKALSVLKGNSITLIDGVSLIVMDKEIVAQNLAKVKMGDYFVYLFSPEQARALKEHRQIVKKHENCSAIIIRSGESVESVPGVMAFVTSLFAEYNINVIGMISCYTDNIFVIDRLDSMRAYEIASEVVK